MPKYIDVERFKIWLSEQVKKDLVSWSSAETAASLLRYAPIDDVAPVVHAKWIEKFEGTYLRRAMYCSACKKKSGIGGSKANQMKPYCPNCGAKMDEEQER